MKTISEETLPSPSDSSNPDGLGFFMPLPGERMEAIFIERPNRFIGVVDLNGTVLKAHIADPGRLKELLLPGAKVLLRKHDGLHRKMPYSVEMVYSQEGQWVSINSQLPNKLVGYFLEHQQLPGLEPFEVVRREFTYGVSRFDYLLKRRGEAHSHEKPWLVEVKGVSLRVDDGLAMFPDAPTVRGARHVEELAHAQGLGEYNTRVLFVIQRGDVNRFTPFAERDPEFANALVKANQAGTAIHAYSFELAPTYCRFIQEVPVVLPG